MQDNENITLVIPKQKNIALIAHDSKKHEMIEWCKKNKTILEGHFLCGTGTTARMVAEQTGLPVRFDIADNEIALCGCLFTNDTDTKRVTQAAPVRNEIAQ